MKSVGITAGFSVAWRHSGFRWWPREETGGSEDTEETTVVHKGMWGRGLWESTLFLRFPLFSPWICSTGPQAQPASVHGLFLTLWPTSIPAILSLPIRYLLPGFLIQTTGQRRKGERKRKRNGVILPWHLNAGWRRGGRSTFLFSLWVQRERGREEEAAVPWEFSHWGQKQGMPSHPPCPLVAPAAPHPCPCPSSCAEAAKFEGNTHADTLVQPNSVFLGQLHRGATLGSYLLQWCTTLLSVGRCCLKAFRECCTTR